MKKFYTIMVYNPRDGEEELTTTDEYAKRHNVAAKQVSLQARKNTKEKFFNRLHRSARNYVFYEDDYKRWASEIQRKMRDYRS